MDIFDRLKAAAAPQWASYVEHDFLQQMQTGTLSQAAFREYLVQDYLFLIQFAAPGRWPPTRAACQVTSAPRRPGLRRFLTRPNCTCACAPAGACRKPTFKLPRASATVAYTRYVLDCGAAGDLLELHVALAPCVIGYAEIGQRLAGAIGDLNEHPYREWIGEYAGEAYQDVAASARKHLDELAARSMTESRFTELAAIFAQASRLEADFWQMGLQAAE